MTKKLVFCLVVVMLFAVSGLAQRQRKPVKKTATATYVSSMSSRNGGTIQLKLNGKIMDFEWSALDTPRTAFLPPYGNGKAYQNGAEWQIVYSYLTPENNPSNLASFYFLWSAKFTGRILSENNQSQGAISSKSKSNGLPNALLEQLKRDNAEVRNIVEQGLLDDSSPNGNFRAERVDLNGDKKPEFIVIPPSLMAGNSSSPIWVYRQTAKGYQLLLQAAFMEYKVLKTSTNGYRDLQMKYGGNAMGYETNTWKFNGKKYILK